MNDMAEINRLSWKLAATAMKSNGKIEPYSTSQIRKIMNVANAPDNVDQIRKLIKDYNPAPPPGRSQQDSQRELEVKKKKNTDFGNLLLQSISNQNAQYVQHLMRYTIWNIKIIENLGKEFTELELILDCEGVKEKESILSMLNKLKDSEKARSQSQKSYTYQKKKIRRNY
ncbi:MAG: hypothetical protein H5T43_07580 [Methanomethylovorans sp.]|jgi:hypothetical protein|nr:hypothetical protein [Methanomethylovorans sp.]